MFSSFRALGYVSSNVPCAIQARGTSYFVTSCIGDSFHIYSGEKLLLLFVGNASEPILCLETYRDYTFCAVEGKTIMFERAKPIYEFQGNAEQLLVLGDFLFCLSDQITIWDINSKGCRFNSELFNTITLGIGFAPLLMLHPSTYVNKILIASRDGSLQLWNFYTMFFFFYSGL
jgi:U3 small nucleolar RNA-associated protein 21